MNISALFCDARFISVLIGTFALAWSIFLFFTIFIPRWRGGWKRTPYEVGTLSSIGSAIFVGALGVLFLADSFIPEKYRVWFLIVIIVAFIIINIGSIQDRKAYETNNLQSISPSNGKSDIDNYYATADMIAKMGFFAGLLGAVIAAMIVGQVVRPLFPGMTGLYIGYLGFLISLVAIFIVLNRLSNHSISQILNKSKTPEDILLKKKIFFLTYGILVIALLFGTIVSIYLDWKDADTLKWPSVEGQIIQSSVHPPYPFTLGRHFADIRYRYEVNGKLFEGSRATLYDIRNVDNVGSEDRVRRYLDNNYPLSKKVRVYYKLSSPAASLLKPGLGKDNLEIRKFLFFAVLMGIYIWILFNHIFKKAKSTHWAFDIKITRYK